MTLFDDPREVAWSRYPDDARTILADFPASRCRSHKCQMPVWHGVTKAGKPTVFDIKPDGTFTGTNHWRTCLDRERFKRR